MWSNTLSLEKDPPKTGGVSEEKSYGSGDQSYSLIPPSFFTTRIPAGTSGGSVRGKRGLGWRGFVNSVTFDLFTSGRGGLCVFHVSFLGSSDTKTPLQHHTLKTTKFLR